MQELCPKFKERFISKVVLDHNRENGVSQSCKFSLHIEFYNRSHKQKSILFYIPITYTDTSHIYIKFSFGKSVL